MGLRKRARINGGQMDKILDENHLQDKDAKNFTKKTPKS